MSRLCSCLDSTNSSEQASLFLQYNQVISQALSRYAYHSMLLLVGEMKSLKSSSGIQVRTFIYDFNVVKDNIVFVGLRVWRIASYNSCPTPTSIDWREGILSVRVS